MSQVVIFSKVAACTSQSMAFNEHPSTRGLLTDLRNKPQRKQTSQLVAVVLWQLVTLLIELSIDDEKCFLPLYAYVVRYGKSGHIWLGKQNVCKALLWW